MFVRVQVLQAYPFHNGVFGDEPFILGVTYTISLEIFALVAVLGVLLWTYARASGDWRARLLKAIGEATLVFGALVAGVVYVETRLLWGEILPGIHVWQGLTGGGGYPWGTEQVAYNTCFIPSVVRGDCEFLNYNELLLIALSCVVVGFLLSHGTPKGGEEPTERRAGDGRSEICSRNQPSVLFRPLRARASENDGSESADSSQCSAYLALRA